MTSLKIYGKIKWSNFSKSLNPKNFVNIIKKFDFEYYEQPWDFVPIYTIMFLLSTIILILNTNSLFAILSNWVLFAITVFLILLKDFKSGEHIGIERKRTIERARNKKDKDKIRH